MTPKSKFKPSRSPAQARFGLKGRQGIFSHQPHILQSNSNYDGGLSPEEFEEILVKSTPKFNAGLPQEYSNTLSSLQQSTFSAATAPDRSDADADCFSAESRLYTPSHDERYIDTVIASSRPKRAHSAANDKIEAGSPLKRPKTASLQRTEVPAAVQNSATFLLSTSPSSDVFCDAYNIIAHDKGIQEFFEESDTCFGVQLEIARLLTVGRIKEDGIAMQTLEKLVGSNVQVARYTAQVICGTENALEIDKMTLQEESIRSPWEQLDFERQNLPRDPFSLQEPNKCLGFDAEGNPGPYAGKVQIRGTLSLTVVGQTSKLKLELERPTIGSSSMFARRFGCENFLRFKVRKSALRYNGLREYLLRPFILWDRVYRVYRGEAEDVFLVRTNEVFQEGKVTISPSSTGGLPFLEFINFFNSLECNQNQTMAKWASRFSLGLSNSVPGVILNAEKIQEIPNEISAEGSDMTDGCGFVSKEVLRKLRLRYNWDYIPTAIQVRIKGSKGLLIENPESTVEGEWVQLRGSMIKSRYPDPTNLDPSLRTIDVLRFSQCKSPSRLSYEIMINLAENGVPASAFKALIISGLEARLEPLLQWEGPNANRKLYMAVAKSGGVFAQRKARQAAGESRVMGYSEKGPDDEDSDEDDELDTSELGLDKAVHLQSTAWMPDYVSGCPSSLEETVMSLLSSGFMPQTCAVLLQRLKIILNKEIDTYCSNYRSDIPMSCTAFLIPDPYRVLNEGEIYIKSSSRNLRMPFDNDFTEQVLGDVLIARHPCKLPTDIQKWKAVDHPRLRNFYNVIILPIKGSRRAADYLSGGDYDGDKGLLIWQPELVAPFVNADLKLSIPPPNIKSDNFLRENKGVTEFLAETASFSEAKKIHAMQKHLLGALGFETTVGIYNSHHLKSIYAYGYSDPRTIRLANMFCMILDGAKTGLTVRPDVLSKDSKHFFCELPQWNLKGKRVEINNGQRNLPTAVRGTNLPVFIMDFIRKEAQNQADLFKQKVEKAIKASANGGCGDPDLMAPWINARKRVDDDIEYSKTHYDADTSSPGLWCTYRQRDLEKILAHVQELCEEYEKYISRDHARNSNYKTKRKGGAAFSEHTIETRQDTLRRFSKKFAEYPNDLIMEEEEAKRLKASCVYWYDYHRKLEKSPQKEYADQRWSRIPWNVAFRELCAIKANAMGPTKTITFDFDEHMRV